MMLIGTMALSALAWSGVQDNARQDAVRSQLRQEVQGKAPEAPSSTKNATSDDPIFAMLRQLDGSNRDTARAQLRKLGSAVRPMIPRYLEQLSPFALQSALEFLLEDAPDAAAAATVERMLEGDDLVARVIVARALGKVRGPAQSPLIDRAFASADHRVREAALRSLSESAQADPRLVAQVVKLSQSENSEERRVAAELCGSNALREHTPFDEFVAVLMRDPDAMVRYIAIEAWLSRATVEDEVSALEQFPKLIDSDSRNHMLVSVYQNERRWPRLFDLGMDEFSGWDQSSIEDVLHLVGPQLADTTLVKVFAQVDHQLANEIARWLLERKSPAGTDIALSRLSNREAPNLADCFEYLAAMAPQTLVPLGARLLGYPFSWRFYAEHGDAATASKALDLLQHGVASAELPRVIRDRSGSKNFEEFVRALPSLGEAQRDSRLIGTVRKALARITGPEHIPLALEKSAEIDSESLGIIMNALKNHWTPEHAPAVIAAADNFLRVRGELRADVAEVLAERVGPAGRAALHKIFLESNGQASQVAFLALLQTASPEEERTLLIEALQPESNHSIASIALRRCITRTADPELRALASQRFCDGSALDSLEAWTRALPNEVREAEIKTITAALQGSNDRQARAMAIQLLGSLRGAEAVKQIATFLGDADDSVRAVAVLALQSTGEPAAMPHLIEALRDPVEYVRTSAKSAIEVLRLYFEEKERWEKR